MPIPQVVGFGVELFKPEGWMSSAAGTVSGWFGGKKTKPRAPPSAADPAVLLDEKELATEDDVLHVQTMPVRNLHCRHNKSLCIMTCRRRDPHFSLGVNFVAGGRRQVFSSSSECDVNSQDRDSVAAQLLGAWNMWCG